MNLVRLIFIILATFMFAVAAFGTDLEDGIAAFKTSDYKTAASKLVPLSERNNPEAQFYLAQLYYFGNGLKKDYTKAFDLMRASADLEYEPAQLGIVGYMWAMYGYNMGSLRSRFTVDEFKKEYWERIKIALSRKHCEHDIRNLAQQFIEVNKEYENEWQSIVQSKKC